MNILICDKFQEINDLCFFAVAIYEVVLDTIFFKYY